MIYFNEWWINSRNETKKKTAVKKGFYGVNSASNMLETILPNVQKQKITQVIRKYEPRL